MVPDSDITAWALVGLCGPALWVQYYANPVGLKNTHGLPIGASIWFSLVAFFSGWGSLFLLGARQFSAWFLHAIHTPKPRRFASFLSLAHPLASRINTGDSRFAHEWRMIVSQSAITSPCACRASVNDCRCHNDTAADVRSSLLSKDCGKPLFARWKGENRRYLLCFHWNLKV